MYFQNNINYPLTKNIDNHTNIALIKEIDSNPWDTSFNYDHYLYSYSVSFLKSTRYDRVVYLMNKLCICKNCKVKKIAKDRIH